VTPADVYFGRAGEILAERQRIKHETLKTRRLQHHLQATYTLTDEPEPSFENNLSCLKLSDDGQPMLPHTIVINLDRDNERLAHMCRELGAAEVKFDRFAAIEGARVPQHLQGYFEGCRTLSPGEIGCYASHLEICHMVADGRLPSPLLVLEDDIALVVGFAETVRRLVQALPPGWDIVRLSYPTKRAKVRVARLTPAHELVRYTHVPTSTGAYLISSSGARKFLAARRRELPVDIDLRRVWAWRMNTYGVAPPPVLNDRLGASAIEALSPGGRYSDARFAWMRAKRLIETPLRHLYGMRDFGVGRWIVLETVNLIGRLMPRKRREPLFAWVSRALGRGG
jgi:glycosyl transferase, family 25